MFILKKIIKNFSLIFFVFWFGTNNCMNGSVPLEDLLSCIFSGYIKSVERVTTFGNDVNTKIYSDHIKQWIEPLSFAIKCLNKVRSSDKDDLRERIDIIKLLIKLGAKINKETYLAINTIRDLDIRAIAKELLDDACVSEFHELSDIEINNQSELPSGSIEDGFIEISGIVANPPMAIIAHLV